MTNEAPPKPRVSIVTICLNAAATLEDTIRSIERSDYPDLEYVVVDGGSTDGTAQIVERYAHRVDRFICEPDDGISDAFNKGVRAATGDLVGIVSADDVLLPGVLDILLDAWRRSPDVDVFYGDVLAIDGGRVLADPVARDLSGIRTGFPLKHAGIWPTRRAYETWGPFDTRWRFAMDYEWVLRACLGGARFQYVPAFLGAYRTGGVNSRHRLETMREVEEIQVHHGVSRVEARRHRLGKLAKHYTRAALPAVVREPLVEALRRRRGVRYEDPADHGLEGLVR